MDLQTNLSEHKHVPHPIETSFTNGFSLSSVSFNEVREVVDRLTNSKSKYASPIAPLLEKLILVSFQQLQKVK